MPVDPLVGRIGGLTLPLRAADFNGSFAPADPARSKLIALFKAAINHELGDVWASAVASCDSLVGKLPVEDTLELEPSLHLMQQRKAKFPLLCLHRVGSAVHEQITLHQDRLTQSWNLHYILPALDIVDLRRVADVTTLVAKLVRLVIRQRGHVAYESGALQFFTDTSSICSIDLKSHEAGQARFANDPESPMYYAVTMVLETTEVSADDIESFGEIDQSTFDIGIGGGEGTIHGLLYADTMGPIPE